MAESFGRLLGPARLDGHELAFRRRSIRWGGGAADLLPMPGGMVWGAVFEVDDWSALDTRELVGVAYERIAVTVDLAGEPTQVHTYVVIDKEPADVPPTPEYAEALLRGAADCGLPEDYIAHLLRRLARIVER